MIAVLVDVASAAPVALAPTQSDAVPPNPLAYRPPSALSVAFSGAIAIGFARDASALEGASS
ncbi:MAG: hypothetical protein AB2L09_08495 [Coriobacteriia bacterium]